MSRPGKIIKASTIEDIPKTTRNIPVLGPVARIDMKNIPYTVYQEFVTECNEKDCSFKDLFVAMWNNYTKKI